MTTHNETTTDPSEMLYKLLRPVLFSLDPETSHNLVMKLLAIASRWKPILALLRLPDRGPEIPLSVMGIDFPNPFGLAAGLDKHARCFPALAALGFGFIELGTVTPRPQPGHPRPRLFRLVEDRALINRMGFNSVGLDPFIASVHKLKANCGVPLGINIGKNAATPLEQAGTDYVEGLQRVYPYADYVAVNISSPNTEALRQLQSTQALQDLLGSLQHARNTLQEQHDRKVPIAVKLAPDLSAAQIEAIANVLVELEMDAVIATNTTIQRPAGLRSANSVQEGGLSGAPLADMAKATLAQLYRALSGKLPIIGVGGIEDPIQAVERMAAGADLLQLYSGFIYQGSALVRQLRQGLAQRMTGMQISDLSTAIQQLRSTRRPG